MKSIVIKFNDAFHLYYNILFVFKKRDRTSKFLDLS